MSVYIKQSDLEDRLGKEAIRFILDDDVDGRPDSSPVARVLLDAESRFESYARGNYDLTALRAMGFAGTNDVPNEVKRICLDLATAMLWQRYPQYVRAHGDRLWDRVQDELMDLRRGKTRLDIVGTPEPARNQGGMVRSGDPDDRDTVQSFFNHPDSFGVF